MLVIGWYFFYSIFFFAAASSFWHGQVPPNPAWLCRHQPFVLSSWSIFLSPHFLCWCSRGLSLQQGFSAVAPLTFGARELLYMSDCRMFRSIPGLYPLEASSTSHPTHSICDKNSSKIAKCSAGSKIPSWWRTTELWDRQEFSMVSKQCNKYI